MGFLRHYPTRRTWPWVAPKKKEEVLNLPTKATDLDDQLSAISQFAMFFSHGFHTISCRLLATKPVRQLEQIQHDQRPVFRNDGD